MYQHAHFTLGLPLAASKIFFVGKSGYIYICTLRNSFTDHLCCSSHYQVHTGCGKYHPLYASADVSYPLSLKLNEKGDRNTKLC